MQNLLVTGGAGFIGSNFVRHSLSAEPHVRIVNLDALTYAGSDENLQELPDPERHTFVRANILDQPQVEDLLRDQEIDTIVHFAAESHVDRSIHGPAPFMQTNVYGTFSLLEAAKQVWQEMGRLADGAVRFHHISTDEVYGSLGAGDPPFSETTPYAPNSPYAASKAASDHLVRSYAHTYGIPVTITNCTNNYGPYQFPEKLIPLTILNALEGRALPLYGDGQQIRDWLHVEDHCEALWLVLRHGRRGETYNIGGNNQPTNLEILQRLCAIIEEMLPHENERPLEDLIEFVPDRPGHDRRYAMDTTKMKVEFGWEPRHSLDSGLRQTVAWYLDHQKWIETIRKRPTYKAWLNLNYERREVMQ